MNALVVLVVTAAAGDYLEFAGGALAGMIDRGAQVYVVRVTNDEKDSYHLGPEDTARRVRSESEAAAKILGVREVIPLGYRQWELADVSFTELRDRIMFHVRNCRPQVMFIPNPYTEYDRVLDRYYAGAAAEDAWRAAAFENYQPAHAAAGLKPHLTPELYYYAPPADPRRGEPESTATFVPQPKTIDITATFARKLKAMQAMQTLNYSLAARLRDRLSATSRRLRLLDTLDERAVNQLVEINLRGLGMAEEFRYAGIEYQIPAKYR
jgi:LmbE family N-acetylglucosaminyl deacetylase